MMLPQIEYDKKANAVYIRFASKPCSYTKKIDNMRFIDYASDNTPIGVELLNVNNGVVIDSLPNADEVSRLLSGKSIKVFA